MVLFYVTMTISRLVFLILDNEKMVWDSDAFFILFVQQKKRE